MLPNTFHYSIGVNNTSIIGDYWRQSLNIEKFVINIELTPILL